jgi:hypothetical protein
MHRTAVPCGGEIVSDVDELYRFDRGLEVEYPLTWPSVDVTKGWHAETHGDGVWLTAYGAIGGKRDAFVRIPDKHAVVIVLTNDGAADAKGIAEKIADRLLSLLPGKVSRK